MTVEGDDLSAKIGEFEKNYEHYERVKATHPFMKSMLSTYKARIWQIIFYQTIVALLETSRPAITAYLYVIIKNDDKSEGFSPYIISIIALQMIQYFGMPIIYCAFERWKDNITTRVRHVSQAHIFNKMMNLQIGSSPSDMGEGEILSLQG